MYTTYQLTLASIKMFLRNRQALFFTLIMPLFIMLIFGYIGFDKPTKFDVGLVIDSPNAQTSAFVESIKQFPTFTIHEGTLLEERAQLDAGNRAVILEIPSDLLPSSANGGQSMTVYTNAGKAGESQAIVSILNQTITAITLTSANMKPLVAIREENINVHNLRYIDFLLPGLIALSIMQMSIFSVAFVFTQFKEKGVLKRLLATPMKPIEFVAANGLTRLMVSLVQAAIFIGIGIVLFKVHVVGSYALLALCVLLGTAMFLGLGFTISGFAKTVDSVPVIANLLVFPMMFLGGTFFAISSMPPWLQMIAKFLPLTFFSTALREIMTKGAGIGDIGWDIVGMLVWGAILIFLATITFRFQEREG